MRVDAQKFLFVGPLTTREGFFEWAQSLGIIEFRKVSGIASNPSSTPHGVWKERVDALLAAIKALEKLPVQPVEGHHPLSVGSGLDPHAISKEILDLESHSDQLLEKIAELKRERAPAEPFGDFSTDQLKALSMRCNRPVRLLTCSLRHLPEQLPSFVIETGRFESTWYGVSMSRDSLDFLPFREVTLIRSIAEIDGLLGEHYRHLREIEGRLTQLLAHRGMLQRELIRAIDAQERYAAIDTSGVPAVRQLFAAQGWVPIGDVQRLMEASQAKEISVFPVDADENEQPPTCLINRGVSRIGQDLIQIYDAPGHTDRDPSAWIFWSFACFFAMILGDGGYGALLLLGSLFASYRFGATKSPIAKRTLRLTRILAIACVGWGVASAAYFALPLEPESQLRSISPIAKLAEKKAEYHFAERDEVYAHWTAKVPEMQSLQSGRSILQNAMVVEGGGRGYPLADALSDQIAIELSLLIGVVHILTSLVRYSRRNWPAFGWILLLIGSVLSTPAMFQSPAMPQYLLGWSIAVCAKWGLQMVYWGGGLAVGLAVLQRGFLGLLEAMTLIQIGADVLSYLRLYALSLSGAILCKTINGGAQAIGGPIALVILLLGHTVNLGLGLMGGVIHGLRLNFLEWYHYSFDGGGRLHKPLAYIEESEG